MAVCAICGKKRMVGRKVSHSHRRTKRVFKVNLVKTKLADPSSGKIRQVKICAKCLKALTKRNRKAKI